MEFLDTLPRHVVLYLLQFIEYVVDPTTWKNSVDTKQRCIMKTMFGKFSASNDRYVHSDIPQLFFVFRTVSIRAIHFDSVPCLLELLLRNASVIKVAGLGDSSFYKLMQAIESCGDTIPRHQRLRISHSQNVSEYNMVVEEPVCQYLSKAIDQLHIRSNLLYKNNALMTQFNSVSYLSVAADFDGDSTQLHVFPNVSSLSVNLQNSVTATQVALQLVSAYGEKLHHLAITGARDEENQQLEPTIRSKCTNLRTLLVTDIPALPNAASQLVSILSLKKLALSFASSIAILPKAVLDLSGSCLEHLSLSKGTVTKDTVTTLNTAPKLIGLSLNNCEIDNEAFEELWVGNHTITNLRLTSFCIQPENFSAIIENRSNIPLSNLTITDRSNNRLSYEFVSELRERITKQQASRSDRRATVSFLF